MDLDLDESVSRKTLKNMVSNDSNKMDMCISEIRVNIVPDKISKGPKAKKMEVDLDDALDIAGTGKYQILHVGMMSLILSSSLLEMIGNAFVLPAGGCDLGLPESLRGLITSIPNIGIILTAPLWGRAADAFGRRPVLIVSTACAGTLGATAAFMPDLVKYALFKLAASLFLSAPSSLCFAYAGELVPGKRRDTAMLILNAILNLASTLSPSLAWLILPGEWRLNLGLISFRPWRLLALVYSLPLLISSVVLIQAMESPKYLVAKGRYQQALENLRRIYARNTGEPASSYPVISLRRPEELPSEEADSSNEESKQALTPGAEVTSSLALVKSPHVKWVAITGFLMFGIFALLNGLFLFATDTINKVMSETGDVNGTICALLNQNTTSNHTTPPDCNDNISTDTFEIMVVSTLVYSLLVMAASFLPVSKKALLVFTYVAVGVAALAACLVPWRMVAAMAMSALQLTALGIGPLTAYCVDLFPTSLRGTAVGIMMMFGRVGSVFGANVSGVFLALACEATFYCFAVLMLICACLSFALPDKSANTASNEQQTSTTINDNTDTST